MKCINCKTRDANPEAKLGLCGPCFAARLPRPASRGKRAKEPTEAELDALIAEQLPTMPGAAKPPAKSLAKLMIPITLKARRTPRK